MADSTDRESGIDLLDDDPTPVAAPDPDDAEPGSTELPAADPEDGPPESDEQETPDASAEPSAPAEPAPPEPAPFAIPDAGEPFAFRVDGTEVTVPGAKVVDDVVLIPRSEWHQHVAPRLANRQAWREKEVGYQREIDGLRNGREERILRAEVLSKKVNDLLGDPEKLAAFAENWQQQQPILLAQAEAEVARVRLQQLEQERQSRVEAEALQAEIPRLQDQLGLAVEQWIADTRADLTEENQVALLRDLWTLAERGLPLFDGDIRQGFRVNEDLFRQMVEREAGRYRAQTQGKQQVAKAKAQNAGAIAKTPAGKVATPAPKAKAAPAPGTPAKPKRDMTPEEFDDWFMNQA